MKASKSLKKMAAFESALVQATLVRTPVTHVTHREKLRYTHQTCLPALSVCVQFHKSMLFSWFKAEPAVLPAATQRSTGSFVCRSDYCGQLLQEGATEQIRSSPGLFGAPRGSRRLPKAHRGSQAGLLSHLHTLQLLETC